LASNLLGNDAERAYLAGQSQGMQRVASFEQMPKLALGPGNGPRIANIPRSADGSIPGYPNYGRTGAQTTGAQTADRWQQAKQQVRAINRIPVGPTTFGGVLAQRGGVAGIVGESVHEALNPLSSSNRPAFSAIGNAARNFGNAYANNTRNFFRGLTTGSAQAPASSGSSAGRSAVKGAKLATGAMKVRGATAPSGDQYLRSGLEEYLSNVRPIEIAVKGKAQGQFDDNVQAFDRLSRRIGLPVAERSKAARFATKTAGEERGVPDGTGPHGRGDGPGGGSGDGSGLFRMEPEVKAQMEAVQAMAEQYPDKSMTEIIQMFNEGAPKLATTPIVPPKNSPVEEVVDGKGKKAPESDNAPAKAEESDQLYGAEVEEPSENEFGTPSVEIPKLSTKRAMATQHNEVPKLAVKASNGAPKNPADNS